MIKYKIISVDKSYRPGISIEDNQYWWISELNSCDTDYLVNDVISGLNKVKNGDLDEYEFGYDATIIDFTIKTSIINHGYWEGKIEVASEDIYSLMKEWIDAILKWRNDSSK